uniref:hypothetical protein n=1 Tax=Microbacterium proteolyticum TaxID=1572644 RepID=UPI002417F255|nr:hypothetical protein [Microbacterium proteolyticum]
MPAPVNTTKRTKRWGLVIGADEYQGHTSAVEINPNPVSWQGGDNNTVVDDGDVTLTLTVAQDTENSESLWRLLHDNAGEQATFKVYPHHDGTFFQSVDVTLVRPRLVASRDGKMPEVQVTLTGGFTPED